MSERVWSVCLACSALGSMLETKGKVRVFSWGWLGGGGVSWVVSWAKWEVVQAGWVSSY